MNTQNKVITTTSPKSPNTFSLPLRVVENSLSDQYRLSALSPRCSRGSQTKRDWWARQRYQTRQGKRRNNKGGKKNQKNNSENTVANYISSIHSSTQGCSVILQSFITNRLTGWREARSKRDKKIDICNYIDCFSFSRLCLVLVSSKQMPEPGCCLVFSISLDIDLVILTYSHHICW